MGSRTRRHHHPRHRQGPVSIDVPPERAPAESSPCPPMASPTRTDPREPARPHSHPRTHQADISRTGPLRAPCHNLELQPKNSDSTRTVSPRARTDTPARSKPRPLGQGSVRLSQSGRMSSGSWLSPSEAASIMNSEMGEPWVNPRGDRGCGRRLETHRPGRIISTRVWQRGTATFATTSRSGRWSPGRSPGNPQVGPHSQDVERLLLTVSPWLVGGLAIVGIAAPRAD